MLPPDGLDTRLFIGLTLFFAIGLLWPAMINGGPLLFHDSLYYVNQGRHAFEGIAAMLTRRAETGVASDDGLKAAAASAVYIRSLAWSGFAYVTAAMAAAVAPARAVWGPVLAQSLLVSVLVMLFVAPVTGNRPWLLVATLLVLAGFTTLPWFASFMMPDILAAVLILAGMLLVQDTDGMSRRPLTLVFIVLAMAFAVASHAGFVPLGAVVAGAVLLILAIRGRFSARLAMIAVVPLLVAIGANMVASKVAFDTAEVAPKRFPILLARSIEDGPAHWYLTEACPEAGYAICPYVADLPTSVFGVLWASDNLLARLSEAERDRLRAEEMQILAGTFRAYPVEQSWALIGNGARQIVAIGTDDIRWGRASRGPDGRFVTDMFSRESDQTGLDSVATIQAAVVILALATITALAIRDRLTARPDERALLSILVIGLLANAAIFGGLSAPVDRYQARIIWLVPLLAMVFCINRLRPALRR